MKIETSPCAHCEGKDDENCPCVDKTIYDIKHIELRKKIQKGWSVDCYQIRKCNETVAKKQRRYFG